MWPLISPHTRLLLPPLPGPAPPAGGAPAGVLPFPWACAVAADPSEPGALFPTQTSGGDAYCHSSHVPLRALGPGQAPGVGVGRVMSNFQVQFSRGPASSWPSPAHMVCPGPAWKRGGSAWHPARPQLEVHAHCRDVAWLGEGTLGPPGAPWIPSEKEDDWIPPVSCSSPAGTRPDTQDGREW